MKHFKCVHCKATWDLEDSQVGQVIECPKCQHKFRIHTKRKTTLELESESETKVSFKRAKPEEPEMDLTPMVDVTFQLLIFFMVTASYSIQKALEVPAAQEMAETAQNIVQTDEDDVPVTGVCDGIAEDGTLVVGGRHIWAGEAHVASVDNM